MRNRGLILQPPTKDFSAFSKLLKGKKNTVARFYKTGPTLDQGLSPFCVGFASYHLLQAEPISQTPITPQKIYQEAKKLDGFPPNTDGTTLEAGMNVLLNRGLASEAFYTTRPKDVYELVSTVSPCVVGMQWTTGMDNWTSKGQVRPYGDFDGVHAVLAVGVDKKAKIIWFQNSYSDKFGVGGKFWMTWQHFESIFENGGTAFAITEVRK